jgi:hypothetical protein
MIDITPDSKWGANAKKINLEVFKECSIAITPKLVTKARQIIGDTCAYKAGIAILSAAVTDINIYIAALMRVQLTKPYAHFYVSTDDDSIVNYLAEKTTTEGRTGILRCPIYPNFIDDSFSDEEKFIIDLICLKEVQNIFCTPFNSYAFNVASIGRTGVYVPHDEGVYNLSPLELVKM